MAGYALVRIADGQILDRRAALASGLWRIPGTKSDFGTPVLGAEIGGVRIVACAVADDPPGPLYLSTGETAAYDAGTDQVIITKTYPAEPNVTPPVEVIKVAYIKVALRRLGLLDAVDAAVSGGDPDLQILWDKGTEIRRDDPEMIALATALSIDIDAVWAAARAVRDARLPT